MHDTVAIISLNIGFHIGPLVFYFDAPTHQTILCS